MTERVKYPLTPEAKGMAKRLVNAWNNHNLDQAFYLIDVTAGNTDKLQLRVGLGGRNIPGDFPLELGIFRELAKYGLVDINNILTPRMERIEVVLLQELWNAVQNDFEVSDFFLTTSAVDTIVYGNLEVKEGATFLSAAANEGHIIQNTGAIAAELEKILGNEMLQRNPALKEALASLHDADEPSRLQKMGKVVEELGRSLYHVGNAGAAISAIALIAKFLGG
jgi:hypothetical protein